MRLVLRTLRWAAIAVTLALIGAQFIRAEKTNPPVDDARALAAHVRLTPEVETILDRSCMDCHSHRTSWPWYSHVAPVSWFVVDHVNHGRKHLNFSDWARYDREETGYLLTDICQTVKGGSMPLRSYTMLHHDAVLAPRDVQVLCDWSETERRRLASAAALK